jgi:hypothetical protein
MALILFKWLFAAIITFVPADGSLHPIYVSVTEIEHNTAEKNLEISCKIFTDDFEKTLRKTYKQKIDLLDNKYKESMEIVVNDYIQKHLKVIVDGKPVSLKFMGYEQQEEGIISYFQADHIVSVKELSVYNNILYEYKPEQIGILHITVNGERRSTKLINPAASAVFPF